MNKITDDQESLDLYFALAKRRCELLVKHYRPEIEAVAAALLSDDTMSRGDVQKIVHASIAARQAALRSW